MLPPRTKSETGEKFVPVRSPSPSSLSLSFSFSFPGHFENLTPAEIAAATRFFFVCGFLPSDKVIILAADLRCVGFFFVVRMRAHVDDDDDAGRRDTPRSTSSKNVLKANTHASQGGWAVRLPRILCSPLSSSLPSLHPAAHVLRIREEILLRPRRRPSVFYFLPWIIHPPVV